MNRYQFLNLSTIYSSKGTCGHRMGRDVCFHSIIKDRFVRHMDNHYRIIVFCGDKYAERTNRNNFCFLNVKQIKNYFRTLKKYCNFSYHINIKHPTARQYNYLALNCREDNSNLQYYEINLHINASFMEHKFILKMIRPLYEFPYNCYLRDALALCKLPQFKHYGIVNLYKMIGTAFFARTSSDQFLCSTSDDIIPHLLTIKQFRDKIQNAEYNMYINSLQSYQRVGNMRRWTWRNMRDLFDNKFNQASYWNTLTEDRLEYYKYMLNKMSYE